MPTEREMLRQLAQGAVVLPPLSFRPLGRIPYLGGDFGLDAIIEAEWRGKTATFCVECKALSTPKVFQSSIYRLKSASSRKDCFPMLFVPFLSEQQLQLLEEENISGIDMCGNGVVTVPGIFSVYRGGRKNLYTTSAPIKNIYRKRSSMVARTFLLQPEFAAVGDVLEEVNKCGTELFDWNAKPLALSTVSKALKTLEEDLIIDRRDTIRLLQPEKLLEKLVMNFRPPNIKKVIRVKLPNRANDFGWELYSFADETTIPVVASGLSSVGQYTVMPRGDVLSLYCPRGYKLLEFLSGEETDRFPDLEIMETEDETVFFDPRYSGDMFWASPIQVYLELMAGDKRDRETAGQIKSLIMNRLISGGWNAP